MKDTYEKIKLYLEKLKCKNHAWKICEDFEVIVVLLELQLSYTNVGGLSGKGRVETDYIKKAGPKCQSFDPGYRNN